MEIKLVIQIKDKKATIGAQSPDTDPVFKMVEGDMAEIMIAAVGLVEQAQIKWTTSKKNPTIDIPQPAEKEKAPVASTGAKPVPPASAKPKSSPQTSLF